jgi:hypothetical protein
MKAYGFHFMVYKRPLYAGRGILSALRIPPSHTPSHLIYFAIGVKTLLDVVESIFAKGQ